MSLTENLELVDNVSEQLERVFQLQEKLKF